MPLRRLFRELSPAKPTPQVARPSPILAALKPREIRGGRFVSGPSRAIRLSEAVDSSAKPHQHASAPRTSHHCLRRRPLNLAGILVPATASRSPWRTSAFRTASPSRKTQDRTARQAIRVARIRSIPDMLRAEALAARTRIRHLSALLMSEIKLDKLPSHSPCTRPRRASPLLRRLLYGGHTSSSPRYHLRRGSCCKSDCVTAIQVAFFHRA